jgi:ABC-type transport system substrate-binding protein
LEGGYNRGGYVNERVDELLDTAESTADPEEWARLWKEAQEIIWEEAPHIFMYEIASVYANRANVKGHVLLTSNRLIRFERTYKE